MFIRLKDFLRRESGAVTVDWVVLTAAVVALAGLVIVSIQSSTGGLGESVGEYISSRPVGD